MCSLSETNNALTLGQSVVENYLIELQLVAGERDYRKDILYVVNQQLLPGFRIWKRFATGSNPTQYQ